MKKVLSIVLSIVMVLCMMPAMAFADTAVYSDIAGTKCEAAVEELSELGVVDGYPDGTYKPEAVVTRAEMAKLIVTALGLNPTAGTTAFTDMDAAKWAIPYVGYAESLGIIEGYGNGLFGPNDTVTYDQAITMVVRALGYTDACNEMQGTWPAVYVLKANALGLLKNVSTGATGANRGDVAVLLNNALNVPMVYADADGETVSVISTNNTMAKLLVKGASSAYEVVDADDTATATKNINELLGAAGKVVRNEKTEVISVSDVKSTFVTGKFDGATKFVVGDVVYTVATSPLKELNAKGQTVNLTGNVPVFADGVAYATPVANMSDLVTYASTNDITLAVQISGKTITAIFSAQTWAPTTAKQMTSVDITNIAKNNKVLGQTIKLDVNGDIDPDTFILKGADSVSAIKAKDVVTVYTAGGYVTKIEVGTQVVEGKIAKVYTDKIEVNGATYKLSTLANKESLTIGSGKLSAGNTVKLTLDYAGKIYAATLVDGLAGNYAVVIDATTANDPIVVGLSGQTLKLNVIFADGTKTTLTANNTKLIENGVDASDWNNLASGAIINYELNANNELVNVVELSEDGTLSANRVNANGYVDGYAIADNAVIFKVATANTDADNYSVLTKADVLGAIVTGEYILNSTDSEIEVLYVTSNSADKTVYAMFSSIYTDAEGNTCVNGFVNGEAVSDKIIGTVVDAGNSNVVGTNRLYSVVESNGEYNLTFVGSTSNVAGANAAIKTNALYDGTTRKVALASDVIVYVYDAAKLTDKLVVGSTADIDAATTGTVYYYVTNTGNAAKDDYNLITTFYVVK